MTTIRRLAHHPLVQTGLALALIALLTYLFLWRLWAAAPADRAYLPEKSDLAEVFYPPRHYFAKALAGGDFPLWNPHVYAGYPQFADPQAATFYPIALFFALAAGPDFSMDTLALDIALHFYLVGAFSFLFFRHLFRAVLPALLSALVFTFGGYLTFFPPLQLSELEVVPWLPLTLLLLTLAIERRSWRLTAVAGAAFGLVFLAGRPQSYLSIGLITVAWLFYAGRRAGLAWRRLAGMFVLLAAFALGAAAAQWLPTLQLTRLSTRALLTYAEVAEGGFPFTQLTGLVVPQGLGTQNLYAGLLTLVLAALAVYKGRGRFWTAVVLVGLVGSVGKHLILFDALYLVQRLGFPGYLRNVERLAFAITFGLAALSGYGLQLLRADLSRLLRPLLAAKGAVFAAVVFVAWLWTTAPPAARFGPADLAPTAVAYTTFLFVVAALALWLWRDRPRLAQLALAVLAVADVMSVNQGRFLVDRADSFPPGNDIARAAAAPPGPEPFYRVTFDQTSSQDFGSLTGLDNVGGLPPLMLQDYERLRGSLDDYRLNILLNVATVVTTGEHPDPAYELISQHDNFNYYRFVPFKSRAYLVASVVAVPDAATAVARLSAPDFDYWNVAVVTGDPGLGTGPPLGAGEGAAVVGRTADSLTIQASTAVPRLLVVADTTYPGWEAAVDGRPVPLYPTNVALRGVVVPPGDHTVTFHFRPAAFRAGVALSLATGLVLLVWTALAWAASRRRRAANQIQ